MSETEENNRLRVAEAEAMALVLQHESVIDRLRAELDTAKKERDEARKLAEFWFDAVCDPREREEWLLPWESDNE